MGAMRVAQIVYGTARREVRRLVVVDNLSALRPHILGKDEDSIIVDADKALANGAPDLPACYALIEARR